MSFGRLLLAETNSKKYISDRFGRRVCVKPPKAPNIDEDAYASEVILCYEVDLVAFTLSISRTSKRCDGLVFYFQDGEKDGETDRVICLVEMKSTFYIDGAEEQIIATKLHLEELLHEEWASLGEVSLLEFTNRIKWKACLYHNCSSPKKETIDKFKELRAKGFDDVGILIGTENDLRPLLTGEGISAEDIEQTLELG